MSFNEQQLKDMMQIIGATIQELLRSNAAAGAGIGGQAQGAPAYQRALLDERNFRRIDKFSSKEAD